MKPTLLLLFLLGLSTFCFSQIQTNTGQPNGSVTISPDGFKSSLAGGASHRLNVAVGPFSLLSPDTTTNTTSGRDNSALGSHSLFKNTTGYGNTAIGSQSLKNNTTGIVNTAVGFLALKNNVDGYENVAFGQISLGSNVFGNRNVAIGTASLLSNTFGFHNTAIGHIANWFNTFGNGNTSLGYNALSTNTIGNNNIAIGKLADVAFNNLENTIAIGYEASVNVSNKAVIGNASLTTIGGFGSWTNYSDRRLKENIEYDNSLGLNFILKLKPATYNYISDTNKRKRNGLIAQDVQNILTENGLYFSGLVVDADQQKTLNLSYSEFVLPLINAVKEQQKQIEELKIEISKLKN